MDHGSHDPDPHTPAVRASDAERHETARILQQAFSEGRLTVAEFDDRTSQAYQAQFRNELAQLTVDLSPARRQFDGHPDPRADADRQRGGDSRSDISAELHAGSADDRAPVRRVTGEPGTSTSIAVMSGCDRSGVWTIAESHTTVALMGGVSIDLRRACLQSHEITIRAFAVWGGIEIVVPDDLHLVMDGFGLMGGFAEQSGTSKHDPRPVRQAPPGAPTVRVTGLALMGGVGVRRVPRPEH